MEERPDLAPPRRFANPAFLAGNKLAGLHTRFPNHPVCGARTKRGRPCKAPKVAGANRCAHHGGGRALLLRARRNPGKDSVAVDIGKCLWYLEKAHRNMFDAI